MIFFVILILLMIYVLELWIGTAEKYAKANQLVASRKVLTLVMRRKG